MKTMKFRLNWLKKKERPIPEDVICRNCGVQMQGRYCHECGQDIFAGTGIPILKLIGQVLDNAFALEGKTPRTLVNLIFRPGFLSREFMNGKVVRYVNPVKLFWMSTLIFFALLISQINSTNWQTKDFNIKSHVLNTETKVMLFNYFTKFAPYVAFLLIPFFALLLALFFWRRKFYYVHHLIFTVHFHAFLWIFCSLLLIINMFVTLDFPDWLNLTLFFTPGIYLIFAFHRFYHPQTYHFKSWWQTIWKSVFVSISYFFIFCIITIIIAVIVLKLYFPELTT